MRSGELVLTQNVDQTAARGVELICAPRCRDHNVDRWFVERSPYDAVVAQSADLALEFEGYRNAGANEAERRVDPAGR